MKHIRLFEDFDLDKFLSDPNSQFHDDSDPVIVEGDWINSYRGPGQVVSISGDMTKVQLISGSQQIVTVPYESLTKISKSQAMEIYKRLPNTKKELEDILAQMREYSEISISDDNSGDPVFSGDPQKASEYMEDILVELIDLKNKDPYVPYYTNYGDIISTVSMLCDSILDSIEEPKLRDRIEFMQDKYYEISV